MLNSNSVSTASSLLTLLTLPLLVAPQQCTLCPGGSTAFNADKIIPFADTVITCGDLNTRASSITAANQCRNEIRINAAWCECPGITAECSLCVDGSSPSDPLRSEPFQGFTCDGIGYFESTLASRDCGMSSELLGLDTSYYCGCTNVAPPQMCDLCPGGTVQSDVVVDDFLGGDSCSDVDRFFKSITNLTLCNELVGPAQLLCCGADYIPPTCSVCLNGETPVNPSATVEIPTEGTFRCDEIGPLAAGLPTSLCFEFQEITDPICCIMEGGSGEGNMNEGGETSSAAGVVISNNNYLLDAKLIIVIIYALTRLVAL